MRATVHALKTFIKKTCADNSGYVFFFKTYPSIQTSSACQCAVTILKCKLSFTSLEFVQMVQSRTELQTVKP